MATLVSRGKATVNGVAATFDVILYPIQQSMKATHQFSQEEAKDALGQDTAWIARNEMIEGDVAMKLLGDTVAHATAGAAFLAPLAVVTISGCTVAAWNTTWIVQPGSDIDTGNTKIGDIAFKLRRYVDGTQNTLYATTPS